MEIIILILVILIIIIGSFFIFVYPKIRKNEALSIITDVLKSKLDYNVKVLKNEPYDIVCSKENRAFHLKIVFVPSNSEIQINNKTTWEVKYGAGSTIGRSQPNRKLLTDVIEFMNYETENKVIVVYPKPKKIVKYINECEIVFVKPNTDVYGTNVISFGDYTLFK